MTGERPVPAGDRNRLARAQTQLLASLVAGGPPPPGFDPARLRIQADALVAKRCEIVAKLRPDLVETAGPDFRGRFHAYARARPRPAAGARADAEAFAQMIRAGCSSAEPGPRRACWAWLIHRLDLATARRASAGSSSRVGE